MNGALIILPMGFEDIEAFTPIDILRRANINLTVAALDYPQQVTSKSRIEVLTEGTLDNYLTNQYEMVILPGGPGHVNYLKSPTLQSFLKSQKGYIAAICAAPLALHNFGMLTGKRYTCYPSVRNELTQAVEDPVVVDGKIITSTGPGRAFQFSLKLVELLEGKEKAEEIKAVTCFV